MPSASARARMPRHKTEPLDLQHIPRCENGPVAQVRILKVGGASAARSGGTWQIHGTVPPARNMQHEQPPQVIYARPVQAAPAADPRTYEDWADHAPRRPSARYVDTEICERSLLDTPRQRMADLQMRALRALSGLQENLSTKSIVASSWAKPSTRMLSIAVGVYALVLFLFALLGR